MAGSGGEMLVKLNYYWRLVATGFCFSCFGIGGLCLAVFVFPLLRLCSPKKSVQQQLARKVIHWGFRLFVALMQYSGVLRVKLKGLADLPQNEGLLLIANHPSLIDVVVLISIFPKMDCIVKQSLWNNFYLGGVVSSAGYISNDNPQVLLEDCVDILVRGESLLVFPEGTRSTPGQPIKLQRGAANMALRAQKNVTPVTISLSPSSLTKSEKWYQIPKQGLVNMNIQFGEVIDVKPFLAESEGNVSLASRHLSQFLEKYFIRNLQQYEQLSN